MTDNFQLSTLHSQLPKGYKQTEVGVIPEEWDCLPLSCLCKSICDGTHYTPRYVREGIPFYSVENVTANDFINTKFISLSEHEMLVKRCKPERGDILMTRITAGILGDTKLLDWDVNASIYVSLALLKPNARIAPEYLYRYSQSSFFVRDVEKRGLANATPKKINMQEIGGIPIPAPRNKEEQRAIAAALSDVDALLAKLDQLIAKKRDLKQAAMQQLLTGQIRLVESGEWRVESGENSQLSTFNSQLKRFSGAWEVKSVKSIVETPVTDGPHLTPQFLEDGVPFLSVNNLVDNKINLSELRFISKKDDIEFSKKCKPQKNDLLLGKAASVGKVAIVETDFDFNIWSPIAMIRIGQREHPRFVYYQLQSADLVKQIALLTNSSSQGNIGMGDIEKLLIQLPTYEEQTAIATVLSDMDAELVALEARRDKTRALKQGMMQELLTGRIRLVSGKLRGES